MGASSSDLRPFSLCTPHKSKSAAARDSGMNGAKSFEDDEIDTSPDIEWTEDIDDRHRFSESDVHLNSARTVQSASELQTPRSETAEDVDENPTGGVLTAWRAYRDANGRGVNGRNGSHKSNTVEQPLPTTARPDQTPLALPNEQAVPHRSPSRASERECERDLRSEHESPSKTSTTERASDSVEADDENKLLKIVESLSCLLSDASQYDAMSSRITTALSALATLAPDDEPDVNPVVAALQSLAAELSQTDSFVKRWLEAVQATASQCQSALVEMATALTNEHTTTCHLRAQLDATELQLLEAEATVAVLEQQPHANTANDNDNDNDDAAGVGTAEADGMPSTITADLDIGRQLLIRSEMHRLQLEQQLATMQHHNNALAHELEEVAQAYAATHAELEHYRAMHLSGPANTSVVRDSADSGVLLPQPLDGSMSTGHTSVPHPTTDANGLDSMTSALPDWRDKI